MSTGQDRRNNTKDNKNIHKIYVRKKDGLRCFDKNMPKITIGATFAMLHMEKNTFVYLSHTFNLVIQHFFLFINNFD